MVAKDQLSGGEDKAKNSKDKPPEKDQPAGRSDNAQKSKDKSPEVGALGNGEAPAWASWVVSILAALMVVGLVSFWPHLGNARVPLTIFAVVTGWVGIYPVSYLAYWGFQAKAQRRRLEEDFLLLGLVEEDNLTDTVENLYRTVYSFTPFVAYICLIMVVSSLLLTGYLRRDELGVVSPETMALIFYSHLGAYAFAIQELIRRYNTFDLQPQVYSSILARMLVAALITFVGASVITLSGAQLTVNEAGGQNDPQAWVAVLAFVIGVFPTRGLRWFVQQSDRILNSPTDQASERPLGKIIGISTWHEARLSEMGIDDSQNLATADIRKLLLTTQFDAQEIIHWIDQAILHVKVGDKIERFRDAKVTTFHELRLVLDSLSQGRLSSWPEAGASVAEGEEAKAAAEGAEEMKGARQRLATFLGISDPNELERLGDPKTFPNYAYLVEYYSGSIQVAQRRGLKGIEALIGTQQTTNLQSAVKRGLRLVRRNRKNPQAWSALGSAYFGLGRHEDALLAFTYALSFEDKPVEAYYNRSVVHIILGNYEQAIRDCTDALRIDPRRAEAYNNRGMAYVRKGNPDLALTDLNKALELEIRHKEAYLNRGAVYNELGKFELASDDFERAYLLGYTGAGLWLNWGTALIQLHNYASALEKLSQAVLYEMEADVARAYAQRGFAYLQLGEAYYLSARADLEKAIQLDDRLLEAHSNLGLLEARQNRYGAAIDHYKKALEVNRDHIRTRYNLAVAYVKLSRLEEAKTEFQSIINSAPGTFEAQQSQDYLSSL